MILPVIREYSLLRVYYVIFQQVSREIAHSAAVYSICTKYATTTVALELPTKNRTGRMIW